MTGRKKSEHGQAGLEFMMLTAFIVIGLIIVVQIFLPSIKSSFTRIGNVVEKALETGPKFK